MKKISLFLLFFQSVFVLAQTPTFTWSESQSSIENELNFNIQHHFDGKRVFSYPKPVSLIKYLINFIPYEQNDIVLDFFAGSGTALHSVMSLNELDNGTRTCIITTNNENNICEEVTYERNKRVIQGHTNVKGVAVSGLENNNLKILALSL